MISGGGGDAGYYESVADLLADEFRVLTYDRRGNSRSTRREPQNFEVGQQARDSLAVLREAGEASALVVGNSGGAIIGLELARMAPNAVKGLVAHEPPTLPILSDRDRWQGLMADVYLTMFRSGPDQAMEKFLGSLEISHTVFTAFPPGIASRIPRNNEFFLRHELLPFSNYNPDVRAIREQGVRVVTAAGRLSSHLFYARTAPILAEQIGCEFVEFPGHHISFVDQADDWAARLREILHQMVNI